MTVVGSKATKKGSHKKEEVSALELARARSRSAHKNQNQIVFQRADGKEGTYIVNARDVVTENGTKIAIRYIPGVIEVEEAKQGNLSGLKAKAIILRGGKMVTSDTTLIEYMRRSSKNVDNGGAVFYEFNAVEQAEGLLELEILKDEARYMAAKGLDSAHIYAIAKLIKTPNLERLSDAEIRVDLRDYATQHPRDFLDYIESPEPEINAVLTMAFEDNKIKFTNKGRTLSWDGGGSIVELPALRADSRMDYLVRWMMTDKVGADTLEVLKG